MVIHAHVLQNTFALNKMMGKLLTPIFIYFLLGKNLNAQELYMNALCKTNCVQCLKENNPFKVTYKASPENGVVLRIMEIENKFNYKSSDYISNCKVYDKKNWVCDGWGRGGGEEFGKQYAVDGVAYWNDGPIYPGEEKGFSCRYKKNLFGGYKVISEKKR